jgi:DNA-binding transcriptional MerR regulator
VRVITEFSLEELARAVQAWCEQHQVYPANGQAAEEISERTIRYYRTLGLLDAPLGKYPKTFSEKHKLQLIAIRLYQAQGLPLRKIRDELYGKSLEDLVALAKQATRRGTKTLSMSLPFLPSKGSECWAVEPLADDFLLVSRQNRQLPRSVLEKINQVLISARQGNHTANEAENLN